MGLTKEQVLLEYIGIKDTDYGMSTYLQTYDNTQKGYVPLKLFPDQKHLIDDFEKFEENIAVKYRRAGVSTVTSAGFQKISICKKKPEKILIIGE